MRKSTIGIFGAVVLLITGILFTNAKGAPLLGDISDAWNSYSIVTPVVVECGKESGDGKFCEDGNVLTCAAGSSPNSPVCKCEPCPPGGAHCPCPPGRTCNVLGKWYKC